MIRLLTAVDTKTDSLIRQKLPAKETTKIVLVNGFPLYSNADRIIVMNDGQIDGDRVIRGPCDQCHLFQKCKQIQHKKGKEKQMKSEKKKKQI